jgi:hypothetical protein
VKFPSVTTRVGFRGGDSVIGAAGEDDKDRGGLPLEEEEDESWADDSGEEDRGERSSGLLDGV